MPTALLKNPSQSDVCLDGEQRVQLCSTCSSTDFQVTQAPVSPLPFGVSCNPFVIQLGSLANSVFHFMFCLPGDLFGAGADCPGCKGAGRHSEKRHTPLPVSGFPNKSATYRGMHNFETTLCV